MPQTLSVRAAAAAARMESLESRQLLHGDMFSDGLTFHVDDDRQQCPDAEFTSIQAAVLVAPPGSTIHVCPGFYHEKVTVPKTLRLLGASHDRGVRRSGGPDPRHDSIVQFETAGDTGIFYLLSNDIELDGFVIQGNGNGPGVFTDRTFSGYQIERNTIQKNSLGLYINNNGLTEALVEGNWFNDNNNNFPNVPANGNGIYSDQGLRNAVIEQNLFNGHRNAAMVFDSFLAPNENITVRHNALIDDSSIVVFNSRDVLIEKNFSRRASGSGVFLGGGTEDVIVDQNIIDEPSGSGISVRGDIGAGANVRAAITRNLVGDAGGNGISLNMTSGAKVERNVVLRNTGDGVRLSNSSNNNIVAGNISLHNGSDGIHVTTQSSNNRIVGNNMKQNAEHDAHDDTAGTGTAGTANYWIDNSCRTENRPGLCDHNHDQEEDAAAADTQAYDATLSAEPVVDGDVLALSIPTFEVPSEPIIPILPDLNLLDVKTTTLL